MARKAAPALENKAPAINGDRIAQDLAAHDQLVAHRTDVVARVQEEFGIDLPPFDADLYWRNVNFLSQQAGEILIQQGVWLIALKEALPHGDFQRAIEQRTGMSYRSAAAVMQATRRLATDGGQKLLAKVKSVSHLTRGRLIDLAVNMPEADLEALSEDGGEVAGHTRDEYLKMSRSQLLATLRDKDDAIVRGTQQNEALEKKLKAKKEREKKEDPADAAIREFEHAAIDCAGEAAKLLRIDLADAYKKLGDTEAAKDGWSADESDRINRALVDALRKVAQEIAAAAATHGLDTADLFAGEEQMPDDFE